MAGLRASDEPPRQHPGKEPEFIAFMEEAIRTLRAQMAEGGPIEAGLRCLGYIGMGGLGVDERTFNQLAQMRARYGEIPLEEFKRVARNQYFLLLLDEKAAIEAIPQMLPADLDARNRLREDIRKIVMAAGEINSEQANRLAQIERFFAKSAKLQPSKHAGVPTMAIE